MQRLSSRPETFVFKTSTSEYLKVVTFLFKSCMSDAKAAMSLLEDAMSLLEDALSVFMAITSFSNQLNVSCRRGLEVENKRASTLGFIIGMRWHGERNIGETFIACLERVACSRIERFPASRRKAGRSILTMKLKRRKCNKGDMDGAR